MKKQALLIGMDRYRDAGIHNLRYAVEDARLMANALQNAGFATRFLHDAPDQDVVETTQRMVSGLGAEDLFVLYFSGHGASVGNRHLLLCEEAQHQLLNHGRGGVWVDELKAITATFGGHRAFILDSCRDSLLVRRNGTTRMGDVSGLRTLVMEDGQEQVIRPGGLTILCSCDEDDTAQESERLGQGLFSRALLECVNTATSEATELCLDGALTQTLAMRMQNLAAQNELSVTQRPWVLTCGTPAVLISAPDAREPASSPSQLVRPPRRRASWPATAWWVVIGGEERGPLSPPLVTALIDAGEVTRNSPCWREGMAKWQAMGNVSSWRGKFPAPNEVQPAPPERPPEPEAKGNEETRVRPAPLPSATPAETAQPIPAARYSPTQKAYVVLLLLTPVGLPLLVVWVHIAWCVWAFFGGWSCLLDRRSPSLCPAGDGPPVGSIPGLVFWPFWYPLLQLVVFGAILWTPIVWSLWYYFSEDELAHELAQPRSIFRTCATVLLRPFVYGFSHDEMPDLLVKK